MTRQMDINEQFEWLTIIGMPLDAACCFDSFARRGRLGLSMLNSDDQKRWRTFLRTLGAAKAKVSSESIERVLREHYHYDPEDAQRIAGAYAIGATPP